jgi:signal transduction histidine kinase
VSSNQFAGSGASLADREQSTLSAARATSRIPTGRVRLPSELRSTAAVRWPRASLRTYLLGIILAATVPLSGLVAYQVIHELQQQRTTLDANLRAVAQAIGASVDRELTSSLDALVALSRSDSLRAEDPAAFRPLLTASDTLRPSWTSSFLARGDGSVVYTTQPGGGGSTAATVDDWDNALQILRDGQPYFSGLVNASDPLRRGSMIVVPLMGPHGLRYAVGATIAASSWQTLMERSGAPQSGVATLIDAHDQIVARTLRSARFVGTSLSGGVVAAIGQSPSGVRRGHMLEGDEASAAWQRTAHAGWTVGVAAPVAAFEAENGRAALLALGVAGACLLLGASAAMLVARRVTLPVRRLATGMDAGTGGPIVVDEIAALADASALASNERAVATEHLTKKAEEFETLFQSSPIGLVFSQDIDCKLVLQNAAMDRILPPGESAEKNAGDAARARLLFSKGMPLAPELEPLRRAAKHGEIVNGTELEIRLPGQTPRFVLASATPLRDAYGSPRGAIGAMVDITDRKHAESLLRASQLQEQAARLDSEAANRAKDEFLSLLGHELRNPMNAIATSVQVLNRLTTESQGAATAREIITRQVRKLAQMIDGLLDVGRVMNADVALLRQPLELSSLVERVVGAARLAAAAKGHRIYLHLATVWIDGDAERVVQIIEKLLDNAIRHPPNGVSIDVTVGSHDAEAVVEVRDTGPGIPPDLLPRIFELFVQGSRELDRQGGGLGIGLALVRRLVQLHGGTVQARSDSSGSAFEVRFPRMLTTGRDAPHPPAAQRNFPRRVVVIDDNVDALHSLRSMLELEGHTVTTADDGESGLAMLLREAPEAAIIDIGLPGLDGYELARRGRAAGFRGQLIALSGYGRIQDQERSLEAGFDQHLNKPVDAEQLLRVLWRP